MRFTSLTKRQTPRKKGSGMNEVRTWTIYQELNGHVYAGRICAETFEQAETLAARLNAWVDGEPIAEYCGNCGCQLVGREIETDSKSKGH